ncbi:MAG: PilZ domain-containing protein [Candidatus Lernaella stagnicola]|nr:PilZ domain-containing protein [Candidatus Lernaella stagnicola]
MNTSLKKEIRGEKYRQVLALACRQKSRLRLATIEDSFPYYSHILETRESLILIDRLEPPLSNENLLVDIPISIVFPLTSRGYFVGESVFAGARNEPGSPVRYAITRPSHLMYVTERRVKRVIPPKKLPVVCLSIAGRKTAGLIVVRDLSTEGICLLFPQQENIKEGELLRDIKLKLRGSSYFHGDAIVRHSFAMRDGGFALGMMWVPLSKAQFQMIRSYLDLADKYQLPEPEARSSESLALDFREDKT